MSRRLARSICSGDGIKLDRLFELSSYEHIRTLRVTDQHIEFKGQITETKSFSTSKRSEQFTNSSLIAKKSRRTSDELTALVARGFEEIEQQMEKSHLKVKINTASNQLGDRDFCGCQITGAQDISRQKLIICSQFTKQGTFSI